MKRELFVEGSPEGVRTAIVEDGQMVEAYLEPTNHPTLVEGIFRGNISTKQSSGDVFVDFGNGHTGFLNRRDFPPDASRMEEGNSVFVQVERDGYATKAPRLTGKVSLAGRYAVFSPSSGAVHLPRSLRDDPDIQRLADQIEAELFGSEGVVLRSRAAEADEHEVMEEVSKLRGRWAAIEADGVSQNPIAPVTAAEAALRDHDPGDWARIVGSNASSADLKKFAERWVPDHASSVAGYHKPEGLLAAEGLEDQWADALDPLVRLQTGGELLIEPTAALITIDVNSGGSDKRHVEINLEAADAIARQLRLRNISGQMVIDFISMADGSHRNQVLTALRAAALGDTALNVFGYTKMGLVEATRRRRRRSLSEAHTEAGRG